MTCVKRITRNRRDRRRLEQRAAVNEPPPPYRVPRERKRGADLLRRDHGDREERERHSAKGVRGQDRPRDERQRNGVDVTVLPEAVDAVEGEHVDGAGRERERAEPELSGDDGDQNGSRHQPRHRRDVESGPGAERKQPHHERDEQPERERRVVGVRRVVHDRVVEGVVGQRRVELTVVTDRGRQEQAEHQDERRRQDEAPEDESTVARANPLLSLPAIDVLRADLRQERPCEHPRAAPHQAHGRACYCARRRGGPPS
jgi:hypothetical protein